MPDAFAPPLSEPGFGQLDQIEPVNPRFFSAVARDSQLSASAKERLVQTALTGRLELEKARSSIMRARQEETLADLRIQREEFTLNEAREEARQKRDAIQKSGELSSTFQSILDDPELDPDAKRDAMGRIRLQNADSFMYAPTLRDQYATLDDMLPPRTKPLTLADRLAARRAEIYEQRAINVDSRAEDSAQRSQLKDELAMFEGGFKPLESAKLKKNTSGVGLADEYLDEFENPAARTAAETIIRTYGPDYGIDVNPADLGAAELLQRAEEIRQKFREEVRGAASGRPTRVDALGIPVE